MKLIEGIEEDFQICPITLSCFTLSLKFSLSGETKLQVLKISVDKHNMISTVGQLLVQLT